MPLGRLPILGLDWIPGDSMPLGRSPILGLDWILGDLMLEAEDKTVITAMEAVIDKLYAKTKDVACSSFHIELFGDQVIH